MNNRIRYFHQIYRRGIVRGVVLLALMAAVWSVWSGMFKPFFLVAGALSCVATLVLVARMRVVDREGQPVHLKLRAPLYWLWLLKEMVQSSLRVAYLTLAPSLPINPSFGWVKSSLSDDIAHTIYANSITLTPGTVATDVEKLSGDVAQIYIHALEKASLDDLAEGRMERHVELFTRKRRRRRASS
jgi:multicomponent Na+:H+ antiporter subunit E